MSDAERDPRIGQLVSGKYRIESLLGQGGMGRVYQAEHLELGGHVALKFLLNELANVEILQQRFRREATALARVRHPGVVSILDYGQHEGAAFMAMEYVRGVPLSSLLGDGCSPLPLHRIGDIYTQILDVLVAAHDSGVVHRDLKPDNVLLVGGEHERQYVKVLDFGLAAFQQKELNQDVKLTEAGIVQGTPTYMSPEQCRGQQVGPATDVYAWGAMLFYALAGTPPFTADDMAALMTQHLFVDPPLVEDVGYHRAITAGMERVVRSALEKREAQRPTALEIRQQFASALAGTDTESLKERAAEERILSAGLSRADRALTGVSSRPPRAQPYQNESVDFPRVIIWCHQNDAQAAALQSALSVAGMRVTLWIKAERPPAAVHDDPVRLYLIDASKGPEALADWPYTQPLVFGVAAAADTVAWVRAGAADISLQGGDAELTARKARRMLKRGR